MTEEVYLIKTVKPSGDVILSDFPMFFDNSDRESVQAFVDSEIFEKLQADGEAAGLTITGPYATPAQLDCYADDRGIFINYLISGPTFDALTAAADDAA